MDCPVLPLAKKADLGCMLVQDEILSGHSYGFYSTESREIYIYVAILQHDVQMIWWQPAQRPNEWWLLHHRRTQPVHSDPPNYTLLVHNYHTLLSFG